MECRERLCLSPRAIEREHELSAKALPQGVLLNERFEFRDKRCVATGSEVAFDPLLEAGEHELLQTGNLVLCEWLVGEIRKGRPPR